MRARVGVDSHERVCEVVLRHRNRQHVGLDSGRLELLLDALSQIERDLPFLATTTAAAEVEVVELPGHLVAQPVARLNADPLRPGRVPDRRGRQGCLEFGPEVASAGVVLGWQGLVGDGR